MKQDSYQFVVEASMEGLRLDQFLTECFQDRFSRSELQKWIKEGLVRVDGKEIKERSRKVSAGEMVDATSRIAPAMDLSPVEMDLEVIYEDKSLAILRKPAGLAVHPGPGDTSTTLLNGLLQRWPHLQGRGNRPGIVHRLDKPTEGLLIVALDSEIQWKLSRMFQRREIRKEYLAYLLNTPAELEGKLEFPLMRDRNDRRKRTGHSAGRSATTLYRVTDVIKTRKGRKLCRVAIDLITGRTHQIRAHFAHIGCPVVGDDLYSRSAKEFGKFGLLLLARKLQFNHPVTGKELAFELQEPERFLEFHRKAMFY